MRLSTLVLASAFAWVLTAGTAVAETPEDAALDVAAEQAGAPPAEPAGAPEVASEAPAAPAPAWDDFEDPSFDPTEPAAAAEPVAVSAPTSSSPSNLGPIAVDEHGVVGRIHTVVSGDTLWDISESYLGTPWVWPSIWNENSGIDNPHRIEPNDHIWITSSEMRRVTADEAEDMIAAGQETEVAAEVEVLEEPFEFDQEEVVLAEEPLPASVEDEPIAPVPVPLDPMAAMTGEVIVLPYEHTAHYASAETMETAARIVDSPTLRTFLTQADRVYLGLGEGEVSVGDEFTIFRDVVKIRDLGSRAVLGYHYDELGWLKIVSVEGESSVGVIQGAAGEMARGDRILPREKSPREIPVRAAMEDIEGSIVFTPGYRWLMGTTDAVYLNVGSIHGVEVGTRMEVYDAGQVQSSAQMPDTVVAQLVVISVEPEMCVAFVAQTVRELVIGDGVRGVLMSDQFAVR